MKEAIAYEIRIFVCGDTFKVIMGTGIPPKVNVPTARFVLAVKHKVSGEVRFKERYLIRGHRDKLKAFPVHGAQTLQPISFRVFMILALHLISKLGPLM